MELSKTQIGIGITFAMLIAGGVGTTIQFDEDDTYYCPSRDLVYQCESLSSTNKTCYFTGEDNIIIAKRCLDVWQSISGFLTDEIDESELTLNLNNSIFEEVVVEVPPCSEWAHLKVCKL